MGRGHEGEPRKLQQGAMEKWRRHCAIRSCVGEAMEVDGDGTTLSRNPGRGAGGEPTKLLYVAIRYTGETLFYSPWDRQDKNGDCRRIKHFLGIWEEVGRELTSLCKELERKGMIFFSY